MQHCPLKVIWTGAVTDLSGYASASRGYIHSLLEAGIDIAVEDRSFEPWKPPHLVNEVVDRKIWALMGRDRDARIHVIHLTPDLYHEYNNPHRIKVGFFAWETSRLPRSWVSNINGILQELWVPSPYLKNVCEKSGVVVPTYVLPHAIPIPPKEWKPTCFLRGFHEDDFHFYSIFQWSARKGSDLLLQAYMEEFSRAEPVCLILKTYRRNDDVEEKNHIRREISRTKRAMKGLSSPRVLLIENFLSDAEIKSLHYYGDCCVSMARAEGFGLPSFEALSFGNPVIVPDYSAFHDFLTDQTAYLVKNNGEVNVTGMKHISLLYTGDMKWGNPDVSDCRAKMREVFENKEEAKQKGIAGKRHMGRNFSYKKIGSIMKGRIEALIKEYILKGGKDE